MISCDTPLQDDTSIASTNPSSPDDLNNFQLVAEDIAKRQFEAMCQAFDEYLDSNWFYKLLAESGLFAIFNNIEIPLDDIPAVIIRALIEYKGKVDPPTLEAVLIGIFGKDNFSFYVNARGELTVEVLPFSEVHSLVFQDGMGGVNNAIFQDESNWVISAPGPSTLPAYEYWIRRFFTAFGIKVHVISTPLNYASRFLYKGKFTFDYNVSEVARDSNNNLYVCDAVGHIWKSGTLGANWYQFILNVSGQPLRKVEVLSYMNGAVEVERLVVWGGDRSIIYNIDTTDFIRSDFSVFYNELCGYVKMHNDVIYYLGGYDVGSTLTDELYQLKLNDNDTVTVTLELPAATGTARKSPILTKINNNEFILTYSYDISDGVLKDVFSFDVFPIIITPVSEPIVLNNYKYPSVFFRRDYVYIVGGFDEDLVIPNRNSERMPIDLSSINNVTLDIGFDMLKCATVTLSELDSVRILTDDTSDKIVYGL